MFFRRDAAAAKALAAGLVFEEILIINAKRDRPAWSNLIRLKTPSC
jgi:hypothetical protein